MARLPRLSVAGLPHYLVQGARAGESLFPEQADRRHFLALTYELLRGLGVKVHAYALLASEFRLIATPGDTAGLSRLMQSIGRRYVPYFNRRYQRAGPLWGGRFRCSVIDPAQHLLDAMIHVEAWPAMDSDLARPEAFVWSSHAHNTGSMPDKLISFHEAYWALGNTPFDREQKYRQRFNAGVAAHVQARIEASLASGYAIAEAPFADRLELQTGRKLKRGRPGRPTKRRAFDH